MRRISITTVLLFITMVFFGQSVKTVKTYYDYFETKIKAIEQVTQDFEMHGAQKYYLEDGCLWREYNYKFGKQDGIQKQLYCNGKINIISNYKDGLKQGEYKSYKYDKEKYYLEEKYIYDKDVAVEYTSFFSNGNKYVHNVLNGICTEYYENGKKMTEYTNVNGYQDGKMTVWYENGKMAYEGFYKEGKNDGEWKYFDNNGEVYRTEYWKFTPNVSSNIKIGKWKFFYKVVNEKWIITNQVDSAEYFRVIDYDFKVPKEILDYAKSSNVFKAYDYYITGEKQWEGFIDEENMSTSYFNTKVFVEVGDCKFYNKDGTINSSGFLMHNKKKDAYDYSPIKVGTWFYYNNTNEIEYAEIWQLEKGYHGNASKLIKTKSKEDLITEKANFDEFSKNGDALFNQNKYSEAITFYDKALAIFPDNIEIKQKIQNINVKITEQEEIVKRNEFNDLLKKGDSLLEKEEYKQAVSFYTQAQLLYPDDEIALQKKEDATNKMTEKIKKIKDATISFETSFRYYKISNRYEVKNVYTVNDNIKKKRLYEAYLILEDNIYKKIEQSDDVFYKQENLNLLLKLIEKMKILLNENTKDIEKQLKSETNPEKIREILGL